jgi:hypothetical protein
MKRPIIEQMPDPNFPGLRVCSQGCADQKDPYRLPARQTERITLQYPRPDTDIATDPNYLTTDPDLYKEPYGDYIISTEQSGDTPAQNGNQATITLSPD